MNTFTLEVFDDEGNQCSFYTVRWEDDTYSETEKFFQKFRNDERLKYALRELATFIEVVIGNEKGALEDFFRFENAAQALPPSGRHKVEDIYINYGNFPLRLYCLRISGSLVVLFNGGEKTSGTAQRGQTSMAFHEANVFANRILDALNEKDIYIAANQREIKDVGGNDEIIL